MFYFLLSLRQAPRTSSASPARKAGRWRTVVLHSFIFTAFGPLIGGFICPLIVAAVFPHGRPGDFHGIYLDMSKVPWVLSKYPSAFLFFSYFMGGIPALLAGLASGFARRLAFSRRKFLLLTVMIGFTVSFLFGGTAAAFDSTFELSLKQVRFGAIYGLIGAIAAAACYGLTIWLSAIFRNANEDPDSRSGHWPAP